MCCIPIPNKVLVLTLFANNKQIEIFSEYENYVRYKKNCMREPGVEPGSIAWKTTMLTATPLTLVRRLGFEW